MSEDVLQKKCPECGYDKVDVDVDDFCPMCGHSIDDGKGCPEDRSDCDETDVSGEECKYYKVCYHITDNPDVDVLRAKTKKHWQDFQPPSDKKQNYGTFIVPFEAEFKKKEEENKKLEENRLTELTNHNRIMDEWRQNLASERLAHIKEIKQLQDEFKQVKNDRDGYAVTILKQNTEIKKLKEELIITKIADMRAYGLITSRGIKVTDLGKRLTWGETEEEKNTDSKEALLNIPLWKELYSKFGKTLPTSNFWAQLGKIAGLEAPDAQKAEENVRKAYLDDFQYMKEEKTSEKGDKGMEGQDKIDINQAKPPEELEQLTLGANIKIWLPKGDKESAKKAIQLIKLYSGIEEKD
jgi:hypothetical protein